VRRHLRALGVGLERRQGLAVCLLVEHGGYTLENRAPRGYFSIPHPQSRAGRFNRLWLRPAKPNWLWLRVESV
jgi:hypothetical protein